MSEENEMSEEGSKKKFDRKEYQREWVEKNREKVRTYHREYARKRVQEDPEKFRAMTKKYRRRIKFETIEAYGGCCACPGCNETNFEFLTMDHIAGGGRKHLEANGLGPGITFYRWLRDQGYPKDDFRLLCMNCNFSIGMFGYCPHNNEKHEHKPFTFIG